MTKVAKLAILCAALLVMICCVLVSGCGKPSPQPADTQKSSTVGAETTATTSVNNVLPDEDDGGEDVIVEIETKPTTGTTGGEVVTDPTTKVTGGAVTTGTTKTQINTTKEPQATVTTTTAQRTTRTREEGWTPGVPF